MSPTPRPTFGKRRPPTRSRVVSVGAQSSLTAAPEHAALFAEMRRDLTEHRDDDRRLVVNVSAKAAFLSALVTGCCLVGFDVSGQGGQERLNVALGLFGINVDPQYLMLGLTLLGLFGGARAATMTILIAHRALHAMKETSPLAYALGGAAAAAIFSGLLFVVAGHTPAHGWIVDLGAGAGSGFFYRVFAGAKRAEPPPRLR